MEEEKQESDLKALAGESVGVAGAVPFQQGMTLELTEIITKLVQGIRLLGEAESGENGLVNLYCGPAAEVAAAVEENLQQPDDPGLMDFDARIANGTDGNGKRDALQ